MNTVNKDFMSEEEKLAVIRDEEDRRKAITNQSKAHLTQMLKDTAASAGAAAELNAMSVERRSQRVRRATADVHVASNRGSAKNLHSIPHDS